MHVLRTPTSKPHNWKSRYDPLRCKCCYVYTCYFFLQIKQHCKLGHIISLWETLSVDLERKLFLRGEVEIVMHFWTCHGTIMILVYLRRNLLIQLRKNYWLNYLRRRSKNLVVVWDTLTSICYWELSFNSSRLMYFTLLQKNCSGRKLLLAKQYWWIVLLLISPYHCQSNPWYFQIWPEWRCSW